jgi:hypothetical protein
MATKIKKLRRVEQGGEVHFIADRRSRIYPYAFSTAACGIEVSQGRNAGARATCFTCIEAAEACGYAV